MIYSAEDIPLNIIAWTLRQFPVVLLPGRGKYEIQPVFVEDLEIWPETLILPKPSFS